MCVCVVKEASLVEELIDTLNNSYEKKKTVWKKADEFSESFKAKKCVINYVRVFFCLCSFGELYHTLAASFKPKQ